MHEEESRGIFDGVRVIEVSRTAAGLFAGMLLADYGADVTLVEPPEGHRLRGEPSFALLARGKQSLVADLTTRDGVAATREWIAAADVLLVEGTPGGIGRAGLAYEDVARPDLVYLDLTPFGSRGPMAEIEADEAAVAAFGGLMAQQDATDLGPVFLAIPFGAMAAGVLAATGIAAALFERERSGLGQHVSTSLLGGVLATACDSLTRAGGEFGVFAQEGGGDAPRRARWKIGDPLGGFPLFRLYRARDRHFALACGNPGFWHKLCLLLDHPEWIGDARFELAPWSIGREARDWLVHELAGVFATRDADEWLAILREGDIPCALVEDREIYIHSSRVVENGLSVVVEDETFGATLQVGPPIAFTRTPGNVRGGSPPLGHHGARPRWSECLSGPGGSAAPLAGVRVLDFGTFVGGPYGPGLLADLGADVIKVEPIDGDSLRVLALGFMAFNRGKRSLAIDLRQPGAREAVYRLVRSADAVSENFRPGVAKRLGLDYESLAAENPDLVYLSVSAHGHRGPHAADPGYDILAQSLSGAARAQGGDGDPVLLTNSWCDFGGGLLGCFGTVAALFARQRMGGGQLVQTSLAASALAMQAPEMVFGPRVPPGTSGGADYRGPSPDYRLYEAGDGWVFIDARAVPGGVTSCLEAEGPDTVANAIIRLEREHVIARTALAGGVAVPVLDWAELADHPQLVASGMLVTHPHPVFGEVLQVAPEVQFERTPTRVQRHSPMLGEQTTELLREAGLGEAVIQDLLTRGIARQGSVEAERASIA